MGKGKGAIDYWACRVKPGRIMFELDGVKPEIAIEALTLASAKLPVKTKIREKGKLKWQRRQNQI
jgi:large subunit ribosomal protein L16